MLQGIIFDLDGTLADTMPLCLAGFIHAFERFADPPLTTDEIMALLGPTEEGIIRKVVPDRWEDCLAAYLEFYRREHPVLGRPIPGVDDLLSWLKERGIKLAIVTGKGPRSGEITMRELGFARYVDLIRYGSPLGAIKPRAIRDVLDEWNIGATEVAYVGDLASDVHASLEAGTLPLGAAWTPDADRRSLLGAGARFVFGSPGELRDWVADGGTKGR